jgi:N-methylhydantoinase A/oxoprolinase/acetone carboxylase beta subunit
MAYRLGVDVGGTFTDVLLINEIGGDGGTIAQLKTRCEEVTHLLAPKYPGSQPNKTQ